MATIILLAVSACAAKPEKVLQKMMSAMAEAQTFDLSLKLGAFGQFPQLTTLNFEEAKMLPGSILVDLSGPIDLTKDLQYQLAGSAKYKLQDTSLEFLGDLIYKDATLYFRLTQVPKVKAADLSNLKDNWYKFDFGAFGLGNQLGADEKSGLDEAKKKKIQKLVAKTDFFEVISDNGIDMLDNITVHHYKVKINKSEVRKFFQETAEIMEERKLTELEIGELEKNLEDWSKLEGQVWVGQNDWYLRRLEVATQAEAGSDALHYDIALELTDFNNKVSISKPGNVREFNMADIFLPQLEKTLPSIDAPGDETISIEDQLKQIQNMDPAELEKQLENLKQELGTINNN